MSAKTASTIRRMVPSGVGWAMVLLAFLGVHGVATAQPKDRAAEISRPRRLPTCGLEAQPCCTDRRGDGVIISSCGAGLGCDVAANRCSSSCGGAGQPCCDGPDTYAPTAQASPSSGLYCAGGQCVSRKPMCSRGACGVANHRCTECGQTAGGACCPPDAQTAVPFCPAEDLFCQGSTCARCGHLGEPPCPGGFCRDPKLAAGPKACEPCGHLGQLACSAGGCAEGERNFFEGRCVESAYCDRYARWAVWAVDSNATQPCYQSGDRWRGDYQAHYQWCRSVSRERAEAEQNERRKTMGKCFFCRSYATTAREAYAVALKNCRFSGVRWSDNFEDHYRWCMDMPEERATSEQNARAQQLDRCLHPPPGGSSPPGSPPPNQSCSYQCCYTPCAGVPQPPPPQQPGTPPGSCVPGTVCGPQCCPH